MRRLLAPQLLDHLGFSWPIDITAAFARCAMSRIEAAGPCRHALDGVLSPAARSRSARKRMRSASSRCSASSATSIDGVADASLHAVRRGATPSATAAANLSLNIIEGRATDSGSRSRRSPAADREHVVDIGAGDLARDRTLDCLDDRRFIALRCSRTDRRWRRECWNRPSRRSPAPALQRLRCQKILESGFPGNCVRLRPARPNAPVLVLIRLASRTVLLFPLDAAPKKFPAPHLAEARSVIKATFS